MARRVPSPAPPLEMRGRLSRCALGSVLRATPCSADFNAKFPGELFKQKLFFAPTPTGRAEGEARRGKGRVAGIGDGLSA